MAKEIVHVNSNFINDIKLLVNKARSQAYAAAANFLRRIKGVKAQDVTSIVNELVKEKVLSANCAHRDLWKVLHEADLYPRSESNWNIFVK